MHSKFVQTSNVKKFIVAVSVAEERAAREAGWVAAIGEPGLGKTKTLEWWAVKHRAVFLRAKAEWRPLWMMRELAKALGLSTDGKYEQLFQRILEALGDNPRAIVVDEVEKTRHNTRLIDGLRDVTDLTEVELILGGTPDALRFLTKYPQWASRVSATARFGAATLPDVKLMATELLEVPVADDLLARILQETSGYYREIKNALGEVERVGKNNRGAMVTLEMANGLELCRNRRALQGAAGGMRQ
jgi:DNA transposition AAA+ family ATPase